MQAFLNLEDGDTFSGTSFGYQGNSQGEVVFSTGMTGYAESLTDPSFHNQILVFTYPLLGNYGVPKPELFGELLLKNFESPHIWVKGVIVTEYSKNPKHWQMNATFSNWLIKNKIPAISQIDTRALTQKIREQGVMKGIITFHKTKFKYANNLSKSITEVSIKKIITYQPKYSSGKHLALIDCGVKHGILRSLLNLGFKVTRVPWNANPLDISKKFAGVVISNGPGDPKDWPETIANIKKIIASKIPILGICLGHQLAALAVGADTYKLKYGHRGLNQPVEDLETGQAYITSQNHGFAVKTDTLPKKFIPWFVNLNDQTNEGIICRSQKIWSVQFHPEGCPGPFDTAWIFDLLKN